MADASFYKDWNKSLSINNGGTVPFERLVNLTPAEKEQACRNIGVASNDAIVRLEGEFIDLRGDMATVSSDAASAVANANSALTAANSAKNQAIALMDYVTGVSGDIAAVSSMATTNSGDIGTLSSDISTLSANVGTISGKNTSQDTKIGELSSSVAGLTNSAVYHEAVINNLTTAWTAYSADLKNDFDTFSAAEDAVITAATAAIPGQVSAEVSGQLSGKQDKLTSANAGKNISISTAGVIDVNNNSCSAAGNFAIAIGYHTNAAHYGSFTHGASTMTLSSYAHAEGDNTRAYYMAHSEGITTSALGSYSHAEGDTTVASGDDSHAEGFKTSALGNRSHAEGSDTKAIANYSHAEGRITSANGLYSHAEGWETNASGSYSHTEGYRAKSFGQYSHAEGYGTNASGDTSHAEGYNTFAVGGASHAEGYSTSALVQRSHAEGDSTIASGNASHTEGLSTSAIGNYSHAEGRYTITDTQYQHVEGQYNAPATGALHVIGNGTSTADRSNIVETYTDRVVVNGDLINDTLSNFMFDNSQIATGTKTCVLKLDTNDWYCCTTAYTDYNKKYGNIFSGDSFNRTRNQDAGYPYPDTVTCGLRKTNNYPVGIVEWKGDISKICWNGPSTAGNKNYVSSWPAQLPDTAYISTYERMFSDNSYVRGPDTVPTDLLEKASASNINVQLMFAGCTRMSGNWDAWVSAFSAKSPASYRNRVFSGCTGIDNYATYTANSALSSMFLL